MCLKEKDLKKMIIEKNMMLNALSGGDRPDEGKIHVLKAELDILLYRYYKMMRYGT